MLASVPDLQCGFSRDLFLAWCGSAKNSIILTNRTSPGTLARYLIENPQNKTVTMEVSITLYQWFLGTPAIYSIWNVQYKELTLDM